MKKAYSHFAALALAAFAFGSCSRANYTTHSAAIPLTEASVAQVLATPSPAAGLSATVVAARQPAAAATPVAAVATATPAAPAASPGRTAAAPMATIPASAVAADQPTAQAPKPTLVQRLALKKVAKQLSKLESRQQNTASVEHTAAHSGSLTILLVGVILLLLGIIISAGWLTTIGAILAAIGLILLLLKAL